MPVQDKAQKRLDREFRTMPLLQKRSAEGEEPSFIVEGYATTFDDPYVLYYDCDGNAYSEIIDRNALDGADMTDVIMQYDHEGRVYARTKNETVKLTIDDHGFKIEADLSRTSNARNLYEDISAGMIRDMSWCFRVAPDGERYDEKTRTFTITKVAKVFDISAVSIPSNPGTEISARRKVLMDGEIQRETAERLERAKRHERIRKMQMRLRLGGM